MKTQLLSINRFNVWVYFCFYLTANPNLKKKKKKTMDGELLGLVWSPFTNIKFF